MVTPTLRVTGLTKSFGHLRVVDEIDLVVSPGEAVGIVGPNGAGKTTLLSLVAGDLQPDAGVIFFEGRDLRGQSADRRCRLGLARTAQVPRPFEAMSVFENVLVGAVFGASPPRTERAALGEAVAALDRTGLAAAAGRTAGSLGLLDRKRLELARALATSPRLLLLDEIAGGLTDAEVEELVVTVRAIRAEGIAVVWIEHVVHALLSVVDRMVAMSFGVKIADGDPEEVMSSPVVQEVYLGSIPT